MSKFVKKPVVVEAVQWPCDMLRKQDRYLYACRAAAVHLFVSDNGGKTEIVHDEKGIYPAIVAPDGSKLRIKPGDWVVLTDNGEFYPCHPVIFESTYDPVVEVTHGCGTAGAETDETC